MKKFGPALVVTAAFIGPGTVTTATLAGGNFGFALVWALLFSVIATYVLQEMAARLGWVTGSGLSEALRQQFTGWKKWISCALVVSAIGIGNAAYQGGNLTGAALGLSALAGGDISFWAVAIALLAAILLLSGRYHIIEKALIALVFMMSLVFFITLFLAQPDWWAMLFGAFSFRLPIGAEWMVIALIGTTVVPYNLFLHASVVAQSREQKEQQPNNLGNVRIDSALSIGLGGLVTLAILSCSATAFFATGIEVNTQNLATQLEPVLGDWANGFFALGLFCAGLTSAITAPLAAAYALTGMLGWPVDPKHPRFKAIWLTVIVVGVGFASSGVKPLLAILFSQAANGLLLPVIAIYLMVTMNNRTLLGSHANGTIANVAGGIVVLVVSALGLYKLFSLF
jgi:NRAMP (natural resistance-associated macrophage protein)-like metal ion transporter